MQEILSESFRLSPQQRHMCALQSSDVAAPFPYRTHVLVRLEGPLEVSRFHTALELVVARHEILRTIFPLLPGLSLPMQVIAPTPQLAFEVKDITSLTSAEQEQMLTMVLEEAATQTLPHPNDPILRVTLLRKQSNIHLMLLDLPTANIDVIGCQLLLRELGQCYEHGAVVSEDEPLQYADLAEWRINADLF